MRRIIAAVVLVATAAVAPADDKPAAKSDLDRLQGVWRAMVGRDKDIPLTMEIKGKAVVFVITTPEGDRRARQGEIRLDDKASPKRLDWIKFKGPDGDDDPESPAIYKLDGDELTICTGGPGN